MSRRNSFSNTISNTVKSVKRRLSRQDSTEAAVAAKRKPIIDSDNNYAQSFNTEDLLKPTGGIEEYNFPPSENAYAYMDTDANDALVAEETQPIVKINTGNIYDDPYYLRRVTILTRKALNHLLEADGQPINVDYAQLLQTPELPPPTDLFVTQHIINKYLQQVLQLNMTVYQLIQESPGINAPLYKAYVLILLSKMPDMDHKFLLKLNEAMYTYYVRWVDQIPALIDIVLNSNGHDVIKEIMTIINQSVYRVLYFFLRANSTAGIESVKLFSQIPYDELSDAIFPSVDFKNKIDNEQRLLTNMITDKFNDAVFQKTFNRYYLLPRQTPNLNVPYVPKINTLPVNIEIIRLMRLQRTPADLFDSPQYQKPVSNAVYIEAVNESNA